MSPTEAGATQVRRCGDPEGLSLPLDTLVQRAGKSQRGKRKREGLQSSEDGPANTESLQGKARKNKKQNKRRAKNQGNKTSLRKQISELEEGEINPSVKRLRKENKARTKRFFKQHNKQHLPKWPRTPRGPPSAPQNSTQFIMRYSKHGIRAPLESPVTTPRFTPRLTPYASPSPSPAATPKRFGYEDMKALGLDSFGSMHGLIQKIPPQVDDIEVNDDSEGSSEEFEEDGTRNIEYFSLHDRESSDRARYITALEEENMTLRERMYILETELRELAQKVNSQLEDKAQGDRQLQNETTSSDVKGKAKEGKIGATSGIPSEDEATDS